MAARRPCTECSTLLPWDSPSVRKTCSDKCRKQRTRRMRKTRQRASAVASEARSYSPERKAIAKVVSRTAVKDVGHELMKEELRPIVKEALTDEVLAALNGLVALTADAVCALREDIQQSDNKELRQKAYSLLLRYTAGNASIAPKAVEEEAKAMQVMFAVPRPGQDADEHDVPGEAVELRDCAECKQSKPADEFVANSDRCTKCHEQFAAKVRERFGS